MVILTFLLTSASRASFGQDIDSAEEEFFRTKVEPILAEHCLSCHSHASGTMEGGLTLDWRGGWETGGDSGPAIIPKNSKDSLLIQAVRRQSLAMPPDSPLPKEAIEVLERWVDSGASDPRSSASAHHRPDTDWWSFQPMVKNRPPPAKGWLDQPPPALSHDEIWNPIDSFLASKVPSYLDVPLADRRTLIRRLSFDLLGIPPSMNEVALFEADDRLDAYERMVDRMLASPRHGERWARHWMDTIHFADTHGFEHDVLRPNSWPYRDYLIDRFNRDVSWSELVKEQLAVDVYYPDRSDLLPALGYLGAGTFDFSSYSTAPVTFEYQDRDDLVTQVGASFLSVTANCARCHDHKFDPISQEDYYALQAVFAGITKGDIFYDRDQRVGRQRRNWTQRLELAQRKSADELLTPAIEAQVGQWIQSQRSQSRTETWKAVQFDSYQGAEGTIYQRQGDGSLLATVTAPEREVTVLTFRSDSQQLTGLRIDVLTDPSLPMQGPGRAGNGNLHLSEIEVLLFRAEETASEKNPIRIPIAQASADFDQEGWTARHAIDGDAKTAWGIHPEEGKDHWIVFEFKEPLALQPGDRLSVAVRQIHGGSHLIGRMKISVSDREPSLIHAVPCAISDLLKIAPIERSIEQRVALASYVVTRHAQQALSELPAPTRVYAAGAKVLEGVGSPAVQLSMARKVHLLKRGDIDKPLQEMLPGSIDALCAPDQASRFEPSGSDDESRRRALLAEWIIHPENRLSWRSIVNRVWHYHFGRGICDTPSDFGRMGGTVADAELLDWLATDFRDSGQSLKSLHRLIVTSRLYRQSSDWRSITSSEDVWWKRRPARLDADAYRDFVRVAAGSIDWQMGGPAIQQFSTSPGAQITPKVDYSTYDWRQPEAARRSIYRFVWRGIADPFMEALDFPDLGMLSPVRGQTISPLQSLALYNNRFVLQHASMMARAVESSSVNLDESISLIYQQALQRLPSGEETELMKALAMRSGLASVCRVLFNSSEFLYVE